MEKVKQPERINCPGCGSDNLVFCQNIRKEWIINYRINPRLTGSIIPSNSFLKGNILRCRDCKREYYEGDTAFGQCWSFLFEPKTEERKEGEWNITNRPIHFQPRRGIMYSEKTVCGVKINGYTVRHTSWTSDVTCKQCLKFLEKYAVCPNCGEHFKK